METMGIVVACVLFAFLVAMQAVTLGLALGDRSTMSKVRNQLASLIMMTGGTLYDCFGAP